MKTPEELNAIKEEVESVGKKLAELTEEELGQVTGGFFGLLGSSKEKGDDTFSTDFNIDDPTKKFAPSFYKNTFIDFLSKLGK